MHVNKDPTVKWTGGAGPTHADIAVFWVFFNNYHFQRCLWSVGVTSATQLDGLTGLRDPNLPTYHKSCEIKTTQKRILMLKPILVSYIVYLQWWFRSARCLVAERVLLLTRANNSVSLSVSLRNYPEWSTWSARTRPLSILHRVKYLVWMIVTFKNLPRVIYFVSLSMSSKNSTQSEVPWLCRLCTIQTETSTWMFTPF